MCALIEFITKTFESYHKKRLIQFANGRSRMLAIAYEKFCQNSKGIDEIVQVDSSTYFAKSSNHLYVVNCDMATCDCQFGKGGRYCKHLCAVERKYGIFLTNYLCLPESDRQNFAKLALGDEFSPTFFEDIAYTNVNDIISETEHTASMTTSSYDVALDSFQLPIIPTDESNSPINSSIKINEDYLKTIDKIKTDFLRICNVLQNDFNPANTNVLTKFAFNLSKIQTPSNVISFMCERNKQRRSRKIHVQPTAIARRKNRDLPCSGRIQSGRPSKAEECRKKNVLVLIIFLLTLTIINLLQKSINTYFFVELSHYHVYTNPLMRINQKRI